MSQYLLLLTFFLYFLSSVLFMVSITGKTKDLRIKWERIAFRCILVGLLFQLSFIVFRSWTGGHFPTSNMFEFISFLSFAITACFVFIYFFFYRLPLLGAFVMPLVVILLSYACVFPKEVQPLIPALQSHWLYIHVTAAALGEGAFAISFIAGFIYVICHVGNDIKSKSSFFLESILILGCMVIAFSLLSIGLRSCGYSATFEHVVANKKVVQEYTLPPLVGPYEGVRVDQEKHFTLQVPQWMKGEQAARKLNSLLWSMGAGCVLYGLLRVIFRKRLSFMLYPIVKNVDRNLLDEVSYRSVAIGYPIFTLGALIFAMIWAYQAWGRFWGWDPKETWALITWLFYSLYLHLRLSRGWQGLKSAWLAVGGFIIIMINLLVINLVISGLHSYA